MSAIVPSKYEATVIPFILSVWLLWLWLDRGFLSVTYSMLLWSVLWEAGLEGCLFHSHFNI